MGIRLCNKLSMYGFLFVFLIKVKVLGDFEKQEPVIILKQLKAEEN